MPAQLHSNNYMSANCPIQVHVDRLLTVLDLRRQLQSERRRSVRFAAIQPRSHAIHIDALAYCLVVVIRHATGKLPAAER